MRKHPEHALKIGPVNGIGLDMRFGDHRCAGGTIIEKGNFPANLPRSKPRQGSAAGLNTHRTASQDEHRSSRRILADDCVSGRKLHLLRACFDQDPIVRGHKVQRALGSYLLWGRCGHSKGQCTRVTGAGDGGNGEALTHAKTPGMIGIQPSVRRICGGLCQASWRERPERCWSQLKGAGTRTSHGGPSPRGVPARLIHERSSGNWDKAQRSDRFPCWPSSY